jgi:flavin-dependent dehydrogenase
LTETDVLVVGGGPAGSSLARVLRRAGLDVTVMDRSTFPRDKVCAGWITPAVVKTLDLDLEAYGRGRVLQPILGFRVGVIGGTEVETRRGDEPISFGIRRCEFDHYLLARSGARLRLGEPLHEIGGPDARGSARTRRDDGTGAGDRVRDDAATTRVVSGRISRPGALLLP